MSSSSLVSSCGLTVWMSFSVQPECVHFSLSSALWKICQQPFRWTGALEGSLGTLGAAHLQYGDATPKHYPRCARHYGLYCPWDTASEEPWTQCLSSGFMTAGLNKVSK